MSASLSTHVLDTGRGEPAVGVRVELFRSGDLVAAGVTDGDGRITRLAEELEPGTYRLVFHPASSPFIQRLEVEISIDEAEKHYHVPLLISPYSCTTYRGS
ncbi:MAG TPA: hydroxyisourate hydrolase [Gaiellaceae bacterium]|nr:hydroxyisourate hydrolase [Gaiellaceae bacterium]